MSKRTKGERDSYNDGRRDGEKGRFREQGIVEQIGEQFFGKSSERRSYEAGVERGRRNKKGR